MRVLVDWKWLSDLLLNFWWCWLLTQRRCNYNCIIFLSITYRHSFTSPYLFSTCRKGKAYSNNVTGQEALVYTFQKRQECFLHSSTTKLISAVCSQLHWYFGTISHSAASTNKQYYKLGQYQLADIKTEKKIACPKLLPHSISHNKDIYWCIPEALNDSSYIENYRQKGEELKLLVCRRELAWGKMESYIEQSHDSDAFLILKVLYLPIHGFKESYFIWGKKGDETKNVYFI